jgi:transcriptional regulator with XRE-family HTH domain
MYSPDENVKAEEKALQALAFIEQIENWIKDYEIFRKGLPVEYRGEAEIYEARIKGIYELVGGGDEGAASVIENAKKLSELAPSKIQRMGIAKQLIKLREEQRFNIKELATRFGISTSTVSAFFKAYDEAKPQEKKRLAKNSIYNIQENMENLHAHLLRAMARFELDGEVNAKNMSEYRQLLQLANKQLQEFNNAKKFERLALTIEEILLRYCPKEFWNVIIEEFQNLGLSGFLDSSGAKSIEEVKRVKTIEANPK